jgi:hypothetical protein
MLLRKYLLLLLISGLFGGLIGANPVAAVPPLLGGVTEDIIQPVPERYRPGQLFDPGTLEKERVDNWILVPKWAAGRWTRTVEVIEYPDGSHVSREMKSSTSWGSQTDRNNNVWHCYPLPSVGVGEGGGERCYSIWMTQKYDPPKFDVLRYRGEGLSITVDARTGIIKQVVQSRAIKTLTPNPDGTLTARSSESAYDEFGHRTVAFRGLTQYFKTGPFVPRPELHESFIHFLKTNGFADFVPLSSGQAVANPVNR